jgi:hypothetical protein
VRIARGLVASDLGIKTVDELALTSAINEVLGDRTDVEAIERRIGGVLLALGLVIQTGPNSVATRQRISSTPRRGRRYLGGDAFLKGRGSKAAELVGGLAK